MTTPTDYRNFALDCLRWAEETSDASQRETLVGMARVWMRTALLIDEGAPMVTDQSALFKELREKLD